ncbi:Similar to hypothetical protein [Tuber melanosporum Mel28]; acc. no. XP_002840334 [Pyronema omphalodes CBS 100304]|uniref:Vezatin n=1 Tax=Pyronema omphalodes (strain CBS 100304) TaxID=1076935 RepID=U4LNA9_PYROM|nr:Similar to hypothetical protein [Tuber melanosporum Mel28]; acc. no. XP_002840334 [Pyronema omphalodes CBS 100304]
MESIVFANSPLAEYLESSGQNEADWGIEPTSIHSSSAEDSDSPPCFAPSSKTPSRTRINYKGLRPLKMSGYGTGKQAQLFELFSRVIDSRLGDAENSRFLERFRYIIIASQLLNPSVNVSHYDRNKEDHLFGDEEKTGFFNVRKNLKRYWIGGASVAGVAGVVLSWVFRGSIFSKGRALFAAAFTIGMGVFLFTRARRKWLRSLRSKAVEFAAVFVENSQTFDILASNAVTLIQEVELVSRGYRLSLPLPPITRLERDNKTRRCARLRKSVLSALSMVIPPHNRACMSLRQLAQEQDLEKYYDIYDIQMADIAEAELGFDPNEDLGDLQSLRALKTLLHRLHTIRRVFLCSLLAIDAEGSFSDYTRWGLAVEQLRSLGNLTAELAVELRKILVEEEQFSLPLTPSTSPHTLSPTTENHRTQLRKLNSLSQALRGLQAKMHVLREESDRTLQSSPDLSDFGRDLLQHYDSIGADLKGLVDEWENARAYLAMSVDRQTPKSPESLDGSTLVGDTPRNSGLFTKEGWENAGLGLVVQEEETPEEEGLEEVFEAVAEPKFAPRQRSGLSREERIRKAQEERVQKMERRKTVEAGFALQLELKKVLTQRPPPRRRYRNWTVSEGQVGPEQVA